MRHASASVFLIVIILFIVIPPATSAETGTIHGILVDSATGEPVAYASVLVVGTKCGATTEPDGTFQIDSIAQGVHEIKVSHLAYDTKVVSGVKISAEPDNEISVQVVQKTSDLDIYIVIRPDSGSTQTWQLRKDTLQPQQPDNQDTVADSCAVDKSRTADKK